MTEPAVSTEAQAKPSLTVAPRHPWDQQPGENDLWYCRFMRFAALGPTRSVSLVATGRRNAYPIPAHWPIQARQLNWRERAKELDAAILSATIAVEAFNASLRTFREKSQARNNGTTLATELALLDEAVNRGGYRMPSDESEV